MKKMSEANGVAAGEADMMEKSRCTCDSPCCAAVSKCQSGLVSGMEKAFFKFGELVASHYIIFTVIPILVAMLASIGIPQIVTEDDFLRMWVPEDSYHRINSDWLDAVEASAPGMAGRPRPDPRKNYVLIKATEGGGSVLTAESIRLLYQLREAVVRINAKLEPGRQLYNASWERVCLRHKPEAESSQEKSAPLLVIPLSQICPLINDQLKSQGGADSICYETSILELWPDNNETMFGLNDTDVLSAVNDPSAVSRKTGLPFDPVPLLGKVSRIINGSDVVRASGTLMVFVTNGAVSDAGVWEELLIKEVLDYSERELEPNGLKALPFTENLSGADKNDQEDNSILALGYATILVYVLLTVGRCNCVENRTVLSLCGLACIGMGLATCYGICAALGLPSTQMNTIVPFLLLGIGVDNMFVIVQCFNNLNEEEKLLPLHTRFGLTMKHAGVAITITSVTDLLAFGVGGSSVLPALRSFGVFAAIGIFSVFVFMITFFFACFSIDQRRLEADRNSFIWCHKHPDYVPRNACQRPLLKSAFLLLADLLEMWPIKVIILLVSAGMIATASYGLTLLETDFKSVWYIRSGTYVKQFLEARDDLFPTGGISGSVYIAYVNLAKEMGEAERLSRALHDLSGNEGILKSVDDGESFAKSFINWVSEAKQKDLAASERYPNSTLGKDVFSNYVSEFLFLADGIQKIGGVIFSQSLNCSERAPDITMIEIPYVQKRASNAMAFIEKMNQLHDVVADHRFGAGTTANFTHPPPRVFAFSRLYGEYVVMDIITSELTRNLLLALLFVFLATWFFLAHLLSSLYVVFVVFVTLVNVGGFMHFWGLTIETATSIFLTISMGLSVDYSAHIAHAFMVTQGPSRNERMKKAISDLGPAVFNGGFSTFLAFALLWVSSSYLFVSFFKVFFLVVLFGLFHGLILLPTLLSLFGPAAVSESGGRVAAVEPVNYEVHTQQRPESAWSTRLDSS